jgi:hypothetical protein
VDLTEEHQNIRVVITKIEKEKLISAQSFNNLLKIQKYFKETKTSVKQLFDA